MSPRAAWRLESLGFQRVYDYAAGKADRLNFGLPYEGSARLVALAVTRQVPACHYRAPLREVRAALDSSRHGLVVAVNDAGLVMGRLDRRALEAADDTPVEHLMHEGPTTIRLGVDLEEQIARVRRANVPVLIVTRPDGTLVGMLEQEADERVLRGTDPEAARSHGGLDPRR